MYTVKYYREYNATVVPPTLLLLGLTKSGYRKTSGNRGHL